MKILVTIKRVEDPEIKIAIKKDGSGIETDQMKYVVNPFDEIAVEEALRVRDVHGGEVVVVCVGVADAAHQIRTALAMGADRAVHVLAETPLDPHATSLIMRKVIEQEHPDLVLVGKQAVDDDMGQLGGLLAETLGWGQATFASKEESLESEAEKNKSPALKIDGGRVEVVREVDGGIETLSLTVPAVITTELRLNVPRYASLPGIMKAKKKEIRTIPVAELGLDTTPWVRTLQLSPPPQRQAGVTVPNVAALVDKLRNEAKVL